MRLEKVVYKILLFGVISFLTSYYFKGDGGTSVGIYVFCLLSITLLPQSIIEISVSKKTKRILTATMVCLVLIISYISLGANRPFCTVVILGISNLLFLKWQKKI